MYYTFGAHKNILENSGYENFVTVSFNYLLIAHTIVIIIIILLSLCSYYAYCKLIYTGCIVLYIFKSFVSFYKRGTQYCYCKLLPVNAFKCNSIMYDFST